MRFPKGGIRKEEKLNERKEKLVTDSVNLNYNMVISNNGQLRRLRSKEEQKLGTFSQVSWLFSVLLSHLLTAFLEEQGLCQGF